MNRRTSEQSFRDLADNVPASLRELNQWLRLFDGTQRRDKRTRQRVFKLVPVDREHRPLPHGKPWPLASFADLMDWLQQLNENTGSVGVLPPFVGVGLLVGADDPFAVIEARNAYAEGADKMESFAADLCEQFPMAYCERSRCGRNLQFVVRSSLAGQQFEHRIPSVAGASIDVSDRDYYLAVTGDVVGMPIDPVADGTEPLRALVSRLCEAQVNAATEQLLGTKTASVVAIKAAAAGHWFDVLTAAGMLPDLFANKQQSCPKCGGDDRFNVSADFNETGAVFCRRCFTAGSTPKPGDGIATLQWFHGWTFADARLWLTDHLRLNGSALDAPEDIVAETCRNKRMPVDGFLAFGAQAVKRGRDKRPAARVPVYDETGEPSSYFDLAPGSKGYNKRGAPAGLFLPGRLPQPGEMWLVVEGVKDAAALVAMGYSAAGLPTSSMNRKFAGLFEGVHVICVPDLDTAGQRGAIKTGGNAVGIAASVRVARLPGEVVAKGGDDVRDVLGRPDGEKAVRDAIKHARPWEPDPNATSNDDRPEVLVTLNEPKVIDQVVRHVGMLGWNDDGDERQRVFVRGGMLAGVLPSEDVGTHGRLSIRPLHPAVVRERIVAACQLLQEQGEGDDAEAVPTRPQKWLIDGVAQRGFYAGSIKPLAGIIHAPTIRQDGSILQLNGYDSDTGLILDMPDTFPVVPEAPTRADAIEALALLYQVVVDFPFLADADRSAWLALVLSLIGRQCIAGCVPLFAITANIRGAGKSKLVDAASIIAYGHTAARKTFTRNDDELRKVITSVALEATTSVLFDNVDIQLGGASLDAALTGTTWCDRVLGASRTTGDLPMRTVWSATGNNLAFGSDIARRVLPIRLQSPLEAPEQRTGFAHDDLEGWTKANRPALAVAALTILRAFFVAGCPVQPISIMASFESWSKLIPHALHWAGAADPLPTREAATENDDSLRLLGLLIRGIQQADVVGNGLTTSEIETAAYSCPALKEATNEVCGDRFNAKAFGRRMRSYVGRVWEGCLIEANSAGGGVKRYRVTATGNAKSVTHSSNPNPPGNPPQERRENRGENVESGFGGFVHESLSPSGSVHVGTAGHRDLYDTHISKRALRETEPPNPSNPPATSCEASASAPSPAR